MAKDQYLQSRNVVFLSLFFILATVRSEGNLALFKTATQSSNINSIIWLASAAVDGCDNNIITSGCCTHTQSPGPKTVWWRVDLGQISTIDSIQIIYRANYPFRFAGYQLYVSNTTISPQDGVLCYEDSSSTIAAVQMDVTHQCPYVGRYVTVYNYRNDQKRYSWYSDDAVLELCEVLVHGCPVGRYGNGDCSLSCPATCYGGNCNPKTGSCLYCTPTTYGTVCENTCSSDCKDSLCDRYSGFCLDCIPGRHGSFCENTCSSTCQGGTCIKDTGACYGCIAGKYGATCSQDCPLNCDNTGCSQYTGYCHACVTGKHGNTCDLDCPINCKDRICDKNNGHCDDCVDGKYGVTCDMDCSGTCKDPICDRNTGYCSECVAGTYGSSCGQACSVNCKDRVCTKTTGHCIECVTGKFGNICEQDCSVNCKDRLCVKDSGYCTECSLGKYGANCDWDCPGYCRDGCTRDNASCIDCYPGKYGVVCGADCPAYCPDNICNKEDGHCLIQVDSNVIIIAVLAVICGLLVAALIAAIICICWLRNKVKENKSPNKTTGQSGLDTGYTSIDRSDVEPTHVYEMVVT